MINSKLKLMSPYFCYNPPVTRDALLGGEVLATICQQPFEQGYMAIKALFESIVLKKKPQSRIYTNLTVKVDKSL